MVFSLKKGLMFTNGITLAIGRHDSLRPPGIKFRPFVNRVRDTIFPVHPLDITFIRWVWHVVIFRIFLQHHILGLLITVGGQRNRIDGFVNCQSCVAGTRAVCSYKPLLLQLIIPRQNYEDFKVKTLLGKLRCLWEDNLMPRNLAERSSRIDGEGR
jgi:hypothetical protein